MLIETIQNEIKSLANPQDARHLMRFFKTGKGEYGEGDLFYGIRVPVIRQVAQKHYKELCLDDINRLVKDPYHEVRFFALVTMILKFNKATVKEQEDLYNLYLKNVNFINNWDLVDVSSHKIVGAYLYKKDRSKLWELAKSGHLWSERIAVVSTFYFIKYDDFQTSIELAEHFSGHTHDLMHKATGWMLREIGKKNINTLYTFLDKHYKVMPRTMLRYAIEKLDEKKRQHYLGK